MQRLLGGAFTYAGFVGYGALLNALEHKGKHYNPLGEENKKASGWDRFWDTVAGSSLDVLFAFHATQQMPHFVAKRQLLKTPGMTVDQLAHDYAGKGEGAKYEAKLEKHKLFLRQSLVLAEGHEIDKFLKTQEGEPSSEKRRAQEILKDMAKLTGFEGKSDYENILDFKKYYVDARHGKGLKDSRGRDISSLGSTKYKNLGELGVKMRAMARRDLLKAYERDKAGNFKRERMSVADLLKNSVFFRDGRFDPECFPEVPLKDVVEAMNTTKSASDQGLLALFAAHAAKFYGALLPTNFPAFLKNYSLKDGEQLSDVVWQFVTLEKLTPSKFDALVKATKGNSDNIETKRAKNKLDTLASIMGMTTDSLLEFHPKVIAELKQDRTFPGRVPPKGHPVRTGYRVRLPLARNADVYRKFLVQKKLGEFTRAKDGREKQKVVDEMLEHPYFAERGGRKYIPVNYLQLSKARGKSKHAKFVMQVGEGEIRNPIMLLLYLRDPNARGALIKKYGNKLNMGDVLHEYKKAYPREALPKEYKRAVAIQDSSPNNSLNKSPSDSPILETLRRLSI